MEMIEVYRTTVTDFDESQLLIKLLQDVMLGAEVTFDLEDCDKVLRIKADYIDRNQVISILSRYNYECELL